MNDGKDEWTEITYIISSSLSHLAFLPSLPTLSSPILVLNISISTTSSPPVIVPLSTASDRLLLFRSSSNGLSFRLRSFSQPVFPPRNIYPTVLAWNSWSGGPASPFTIISAFALVSFLDPATPGISTRKIRRRLWRIVFLNDIVSVPYRISARVPPLAAVMTKRAADKKWSDPTGTRVSFVCVLFIFSFTRPIERILFIFF